MLFLRTKTGHFYIVKSVSALLNEEMHKFCPADKKNNIMYVVLHVL